LRNLPCVGFAFHFPKAKPIYDSPSGQELCDNAPVLPPGLAQASESGILLHDYYSLPFGILL
jgi:hypothetical protein